MEIFNEGSPEKKRDPVLAVELVQNMPLNLDRLAALLTDKDDLFLVWPGATSPFHKDDWYAVLTEREESRSYFVVMETIDIGHAALIPSGVSGEWSVAFVYVVPDLRSKGIGKQVLRVLERIARDELSATALTLKVRDYNPRAHAAYRGVGFVDTDRNGTQITMRKDLSS